MKITCYTDIILDKNDIHITIDNNKYISQK